jgi:general secretion pathway protein M
MALRNLTPEQSRQLALALLVGAVIAGLALVAIPTWLLNKRYDAVLSDFGDKLSRFQRIAATRPEVVKNLESVRSKDARKFFLRSGGAALSAAEAQEALRGLVESNGGRMITMQAPTAREEGRYRQVTANVQITANILALRRIIHAIETNPPFLFVENLMVRAQVPSNFRPGPGQEPEMFVQFDVAGYALTGP